MAYTVVNILHGLSHLFSTIMLKKVLSLFSVLSKIWNKNSARAQSNVSVMSVFWDGTKMKGLTASRSERQSLLGARS